MTNNGLLARVFGSKDSNSTRSLSLPKQGHIAYAALRTGCHGKSGSLP